MRTKDTPDLRPLVLFAVLLSHAVVVLLLVRPARQTAYSPGAPDEPLILMLPRSRPLESTEIATPRPAPAFKARSAKRTREPAPASAPDGAMTPPPEAPQPHIDWQREAELAAQNAVTGAAREGNFRDLSSLTPLQLDWIRRNHMEPAPPGIHWNHPRVQFIDRGVPIPVIWINDRCVLIIPLVFCGIGHIEANGDLFKHMGDPH